METDLSLSQLQKMFHGTYKAYLIGFISSLVLTTLAFYLVVEKVFLPATLTYLLVFLAFIQATIQLIFFFHLGKEGKPHWETVIFFSMLFILLIISVGSLWIMHDLALRTMPGHAGIFSDG